MKKLKCKFCGKKFDYRPNQIFCKYACKMASYWAKKAKEKK